MNHTTIFFIAAVGFISSIFADSASMLLMAWVIAAVAGILYGISKAKEHTGA